MNRCIFLSAWMLAACAGPTPVAPLDTAAHGASCPTVAWTQPPACGTATARASLLPGPADAGHDAALATKARRMDRVFHAAVAWGTGVNAEVNIAADHPGRETIQRWLDEDEGYDLESWSGQPMTELVDGWTKAAGAYAGAGVAADAFRYGALRDEGADCAEIEVARDQLHRSLAGLHRAVAITGVPGVIARGYARNDLPGGESIETVPLFDDNGDPLPEEKTNGTWRDDNSGLYPDYVWEDSCSRDQLIGWAIGFGAAWEVIAADPTIDGAAKDALQADAVALARGLMVVGAEGYDLEIPDADGRVTYHGYMNEQSVDRYYLPGAENGQNALLAIGIIGALAAASGDPDASDYLDEELLGERGLADMAVRTSGLIDFGPSSNYSGYNMGFAGGWLAQRMVCDESARTHLRAAVDTSQYERPGRERQPAEQSQALYHIAALQARLGGGAWSDPDGDFDATVLERTLVVLDEFPEAPFFTDVTENCDAGEIESGLCEAADGTVLHLLGPVGWNDALVAEEPVPMRLRPHSNYFWRSNPYEVNGGSVGQLYGGVDFRFVYWMGRWVRR